MHVWRRKLVLCISYKMKYLQNEARKQKSIKEITLQFFNDLSNWLRNNNVNFRIICIDILYTLDSASNYSAIHKMKPWLQTQDIPMKWEDSYVFSFLNTELKH